MALGSLDSDLFWHDCLSLKPVVLLKPSLSLTREQTSAAVAFVVGEVEKDEDS